MRLHYAWIVAGVTFFALLASAGIRATNALLVLPLEHDFGWDRATVSLALSVNLLLYGLCGPFAGALMTRFGMTPIGTKTRRSVEYSANSRPSPAWTRVVIGGS